jgi:two-component system sensor histidine kinase KdpD
VPLDESVGSALTRLEKRLTGRPVTTSIDPAIPLVSLDPVLFEQVLINLIENASKHTPPGTPIDVSARSRPGEVEIEVADRGPGLTPGEEDLVFEKFQRGAQAGPTGVGLGLAICRAIVLAHGGHITAQNRPGGGALFRVVLPQQGEPPPLQEARP